MLPVEVGRVIGGKYELVRLLGRGSMGEVWAAHHRTLGEQVALKLLAPTSSEPEWECRAAAASRFQFEAQVAARLSRKTRHIVRVTDHGEEEDGLAYLVMELLEGKTLERALLFGCPPPSEVTGIVTQIARALQYAHDESVVHRDLKPANIFLARDEEGGLLVKLLDFGIARAIRTQRIFSPIATGDGLIFGTPGYMSPEQACGARLDARVDIWALATVAYEALTGALPLEGSTTEELLRNLQTGRLVPIHERDPSLPPALGGFFDIAFAQQIERRFATASELALAFERANVTSEVSVGKTKPLGSGYVRGDTLPMALDPRDARNNSSPPRGIARVAAALFAAGAVLLGAGIAHHVAPRFVARRAATVLPVSSEPSAPSPPIVEEPPAAPRIESAAPSPPPPAAAPAQTRLRRTTASPTAMPTAGPAPSPPLPSSVPPVLTAPHEPIDKSAVF